MLNAAEAAMDRAAEDDAERQRNRAKLYAPPPGQARPRSAGAGRMSRAEAMRLAQQMAAQDRQLQSGRAPGR